MQNVLSFAFSSVTSTWAVPVTNGDFTILPHRRIIPCGLSFHTLAPDFIRSRKGVFGHRKRPPAVGVVGGQSGVVCCRRIPRPGILSSCCQIRTISAFRKPAWLRHIEMFPRTGGSTATADAGNPGPRGKKTIFKNGFIAPTVLFITTHQSWCLHCRNHGPRVAVHSIRGTPSPPLLYATAGSISRPKLGTIQLQVVANWSYKLTCFIMLVYKVHFKLVGLLFAIPAWGP